MMNAATIDLLAARVTIAGHVRCTGDGEGYVLLDLERGVYLSLDGVSARIWSGLLSGVSPRQIATEISGLCAVPFERVAGDMSRFLQSLHAKGLVTFDA